MDMVLVLVLGLVAGTIGGVIGFGTSILLMPALVITFGPREAVPIMAVASLMANASRVAAWWREVDWRAVAAYSVTGVPAAALGALTLLRLPPGLIELGMGLFFIAMIPLRRWMLARHWRIGHGQLALAGALVGFLTGVTVSTGPVNTPFFLMHGLVKGAYLSTEAMASLAVFASKAATFRSQGALPLSAVLQGMVVGSSITAGSFLAKRFVRALDAARFRLLMDGVLLAAGLAMLWAAWAHAGA